MLYCSGESVLSSFYNETPIEEFVGKNFIPAQKWNIIPWVCSPQPSHCNDHTNPAPGPEHRTAEN